MTRTPAEFHTCYIRSTADPADGKAACLLNWGPIEALLTPEATMSTARDLMAAAAAAETDIALLEWCREDLKADLETAGHMVLDIRKRRAHAPGTLALRINAIAGARTGKPLVHIQRGSMKGELTPDEARTMALNWTETAVAAHIDARLRYALGEWDHLTPNQVEELFGILQRVQR